MLKAKADIYRAECTRRISECVLLACRIILFFFRKTAGWQQQKDVFFSSNRLLTIYFSGKMMVGTSLGSSSRFQKMHHPYNHQQWNRTRHTKTYPWPLAPKLWREVLLLLLSPFFMQFWLSHIFNKNAYPLNAQKGSLRNVTVVNGLGLSKNTQK